MQAYNIDTPEKVTDLWETRVIAIEGMSCENCVKTLIRAIKRVNGIKEVQVDRNHSRATVTFDTTKTDIAAIHEAILTSGYTPAREAQRS